MKKQRTLQPVRRFAVIGSFVHWFGVSVLLLLLSTAPSVRAQAPGVTWSTNIGARLFAVDDQTNAYANAGGTVIRLDPSGAPIETNAICPAPNTGVAARDALGNFYFTGK